MDMKFFKGEFGVATKVMPEVMDVINRSFQKGQTNGFSPSSRTGALIEVNWNGSVDDYGNPDFVRVQIGGCGENLDSGITIFNVSQFDKVAEKNLPTGVCISQKNMMKPVKKQNDDFSICIRKFGGSVSIETKQFASYQKISMDWLQLKIKPANFAFYQWSSRNYLSDEGVARVLEGIIAAYKNFHSSNPWEIYTIANKAVEQEQAALTEMAHSISQKMPEDISCKDYSGEKVSFKEWLEEIILRLGDIEAVAQLIETLPSNDLVHEGREKFEIVELVRIAYDEWLQDWIRSEGEKTFQPKI